MGIAGVRGSCRGHGSSTREAIAEDVLIAVLEMTDAGVRDALDVSSAPMRDEGHLHDRSPVVEAKAMNDRGLVKVRELVGAAPTARITR